jgi:uncharacterized protein (DUF1499 family)
MIALKVALYGLAALAALTVLVLIAGQLGLLRGPQPRRLGLAEGKFKPPSKTPNSVSSQADLWPEHPQRDYARIAPLAYSGDADAAWARLRTVIANFPGAALVTAEGDYLYAQFASRWLRFVDDAEFRLDRGAGVIQLRSASRLGRKDYGVNRARIESIRRRLAAAA